MGTIIPQIQPNLIYPPGASMLPHNYQAMHPIGYNPYAPPYPIPQMSGYPPNMVNMSYINPSSNNGINTHNSVSPNSNPLTAQISIDNKSTNNETKGDFKKYCFLSKIWLNFKHLDKDENPIRKDETKNGSKISEEEEEKNKTEKEKSKNSMLSYIYGGQI